MIASQLKKILTNYTRNENLTILHGLAKPNHFASCKKNKSMQVKGLGK
jgi:hypothetical protein